MNNDEIIEKNCRYMARRAKESKFLPFIMMRSYVACIDMVAQERGEWHADELGYAIFSYGAQGDGITVGRDCDLMATDLLENDYEDIDYCYANFTTDQLSNAAFWAVQREISDSQEQNFYYIDRNQMVFVEEYAEEYREFIKKRQADPDWHQFLPFVFRATYTERLMKLPPYERGGAFRRIIHAYDDGFRQRTNGYGVDEIDTAVIEICAGIRHDQEEFIDFLQREKDEKELFNEFLSDLPLEPDFSEELEKLNAALKRIFDPEHKSVYSSFWFYKSYAYTAFDIFSENSRHGLLEAIMRYGTEGDRGLYEITDPKVKIPFIQIRASIEASQKRYQRAKINGKKGGRKEQFPKELFIELAKRGFGCADEIAYFLECSPRTVERKISDDALDSIMCWQHNVGRRRRIPGFSTNPMKDASLYQMLQNTGREKFKDLGKEKKRE